MITAEKQGEQVHSADGSGKGTGAPAKSKRSWFFRWSVRLGISGFVLLVCFGFRAPLLSGLGHAWVVNETVSSADATVVLGGGLQTRPFKAARLFKALVSTNILVVQPRLDPTDRLGITKSDAEKIVQILLKLEVPASAVVRFGKGVSSTCDEAVVLRDWLREHVQVKSVVIPTDTFHTRRVKWLFEKVLKDTGVTVKVVIAESEEYNLTNWWRKEPGFIAFETEVIKYVLYRYKY